MSKQVNSKVSLSQQSTALVLSSKFTKKSREKDSRKTQYTQKTNPNKTNYR